MGQSLVQVNGLCKSYRLGGQLIYALDDVSLSVAAGEFLAILGRSGSGKSTLLHVLGLLDRPDAGGYTLGGRCMTKLHEDARASIRNREIGFVFQQPTLLARTNALDNVALPLTYAAMRRRERTHVAEEALGLVGLAARAQHWPGQLSGGEQQRVAIARAIVTQPSLILADEPTGALDVATGDEILSLFEGLNARGMTIIMVTHDQVIARRAHRCIALRDGHVGAADAELVRGPEPHIRVVRTAI